MDNSFDTISLSDRMSMQRNKIKLLIIIPQSPTKRNITNLVAVLSFTLKLYALFNVKLVVIPASTLIQFDSR